VPTAGARYRADADDCVRSVMLGDLHLLFHRPSGITHILAPPAPQILDALNLGACDAAELLRRLRAAFDLDEPEAGQLIEARLDELEAAGLVSRL